MADHKGLCKAPGRDQLRKGLGSVPHMQQKVHTKHACSGACMRIPMLEFRLLLGLAKVTSGKKIFSCTAAIGGESKIPSSCQAERVPQCPALALLTGTSACGLLPILSHGSVVYERRKEPMAQTPTACCTCEYSRAASLPLKTLATKLPPGLRTCVTTVSAARIS